MLHRLIDLTVGHSCPKYRITLKAESRADLQAWNEFIDNFNGKLCFLLDAWISSDTLRLYSDAAGVHGGDDAVFGSNWFTVEWSPAMQLFHITIKELFPIVLLRKYYLCKHRCFYHVTPVQTLQFLS